MENKEVLVVCIRTSKIHTVKLTKEKINKSLYNARSF